MKGEVGYIIQDIGVEGEVSSVILNIEVKTEVRSIRYAVYTWLQIKQNCIFNLYDI